MSCTTRNTAVLVIIMLAATALHAQRSPRPRRHYDPATVVTLKGTVVEVQQQTGRTGRPGTHLLLETASGNINVHLGPTSYLDQQGLTPAVGDAVEVTGSRVQIGGAEALVARELTLGDRVLALRNHDGVPLWSRGRRRP